MLIECLPRCCPIKCEFRHFGERGEEEEKHDPPIGRKVLRSDRSIHWFDDGLARRIFAEATSSHAQSVRTLWFGSTLRDALRVLPIARKTGGLADTIDHFSHSTLSANGFLLKSESEKLKMVIHRAIKLFGKAGQFSKIRKNPLVHGAMQQTLRRSLRLDPEISRVIQAGLSSCITLPSFL